MTRMRALRTGLLGLAAAVTLCVAAPLAAETVLIPSRIIYPGETIEAAALKEVSLLEGKTAPKNVLVERTELEGKIAKRTLLPGRYVPVNALREAWLVEKGATVEAVFVAGTLTISASAVTLQAGLAGDQIKVRNIDSGKILTGMVLGDGSIRVGGT